ncbi:MAG: binding-protein-dependent transport system inner rane component [Deltaproteobacteria bacterium]|nr:binding-protein-dependent transport system inner rane component [Deltaproteobacteria bacterium]MBP1716780.1 binding-protein-dependent transport system inner rane component [Deltaproteobacteria bacterium]
MKIIPARTEVGRAAYWHDRFRDLKRNRLAFLGSLVVFAIVCTALLAPVIQMHDPLKQDIAARMQKPSLSHFLGTDQFGRDLWSRIVHGARVSLMVGILAVSIGVFLGTPIGAVAGYYRGRVDEVIMRTMDAFLAFPPLLLALVVVAILGSSLFNTMIAIGIVYIPRFARVIRGSVLVEREKEYVEASKVVGESNASILFRQILPNCLSPLIVQSTVFIAYAILTEAMLSFMGLGIAPPSPSWGSMLNEARQFMESAPLLAIFPGLFISITVLGFNLFGDGLRDILDPRLTEQ